MKKNRKKPATKGKSKIQPQPLQTRRQALGWLRGAAIAVPILAGAGYFGVRSVQATIDEADLTKIGKGVPSIVQIHDPGCSICAALQKQTRKALSGFDGDGHTFLVANIKTLEGSTLAAKYAVPHVTLLLFDAKGEMQQVIRGLQTASDLEPIFAAHLAGQS